MQDLKIVDKYDRGGLGREVRPLLTVKIKEKAKETKIQKSEWKSLI